LNAQLIRAAALRLHILHADYYICISLSLCLNCFQARKNLNIALLWYVTTFISVNSILTLQGILFLTSHGSVKHRYSFTRLHGVNLHLAGSENIKS
jgi:hypothetical protein